MGIVGNNAEASVGRVLFHDATEGHLGSGGHRIGLVKNDELEASQSRARRRGAESEDLLGGGKSLDLLAHNVDTTVVGGVQLEHHLAHVGGAIDSSGKGKDGGCFAGTGRTVEKQMGESVRVDEFVDGCEDVLVARHIGERDGAVLFDPVANWLDIMG